MAYFQLSKSDKSGQEVDSTISSRGAEIAALVEVEKSLEGLRHEIRVVHGERTWHKKTKMVAAMVRLSHPEKKALMKL